jgi:uncharacterized membrane protein
MPHAENEITINRPVEEVFTFLGDAENDRKWRRGVLDIARVSGEGVGARYNQGIKGPFGKRVAADFEITEYRPDELIAFKALSGPVHPEGRYELSESDGGTCVRFRLDAEVKGVKRLIAPMVERAMRSEVERLDDLKRVLESG